jgi:hypothetical protein
MKTMRKTVLKCIILMTAVLSLSSCASIVTKSTYPLTINSNPSDASVTITNSRGAEVYTGSTPTVVQLKASEGFFSKADYQVKFSKPGYDDKIIPVTFSLDGWYFGNILLGGVIGMLIVDPATGAMWKIDIDQMNATLNQSTTSAAPELRVIDISEVPENWKSKLVQLD